ncbi:hypothetical protein GCM10009122_26140 [Fulvivirga kasyanovii]|uniref:Glyoxalase n=1 Tax=Fulvivirga kasyanovii TaxID=396812 RepID=A0ABW9RQD3_9BACT|nr:VOC family protein [Fulvivirga kasyanovii]MTI26379.1 glyoxalase [Fulvivirga kasyanovii]
MKIGMTSVFVNNPMEAFKFYTEVLGFVKIMYMPEHYLAIVASAEEPEGTTLLLEPNNSPIAQNYQTELRKAGLPCIVFQTDDIQNDYQRLKELGVEFKKEPTQSEWGTEAIFDDTCGNYIQLHQMP